VPPIIELLVRTEAVDRVVTLLKHPRLLSANFDYRNSIYVAGSGRSGTTWLANIINYDKRYRSMFEPFDARYVAEAAPFSPALYLRATDDRAKYFEPARCILAGKVGNRRVDAGNRRLFRRQRIIKEIRGNLWLKWLRERFPEIPTVFIMRHPCGVVTSRMDLEWSTLIPEYLSQSDLVEDHLEPLCAHLANAKSAFERHVFSWCIQQYVPLRQLKRGDVHVVFYENLCIDAPAEIARLFAFLGRRYDTRALRSVTLSSNTNWLNTTIKQKSGEDLASGWQRRVSVEQVKQATNILKLFGLDAIYDDNPLPKVKNLDPFLQPAASFARCV